MKGTCRKDKKLGQEKSANGGFTSLGSLKEGLIKINTINIAMKRVRWKNKITY